MNFSFFTFGGALFWEDVFFYQKWRIQRHCFSKKYRLLDSWDIRRASGTFENCRKAFIECIDSYEITKQPNHMIILLHGYADGKNIFKNLWRKLILTNSSVASLNYPSLFRNSTESALQLLFFLNHMEGIEEVSFVTKGAGTLVLEKALNMPIEYQTFSDKVVIKKSEVEETTKVGIILTGSAKEKPDVYEVVAVGPGGMVDGKEIKMVLNVADRVIVGKYSGTEVKLDGVEYTVVSQSDILAVVE